MIEVGRNLWKPSGWGPPVKQGHLDHVTLDHVQTANLSTLSFDDCIMDLMEKVLSWMKDAVLFKPIGVVLHEM